MVAYKQKCPRCRKNYVLVTNRKQYVICHECQKKEMEGEITDPEMIKLFDIDEKLYEESSFLRDIKIKYLKFGSLSERQIEAFERVAEELAEEKKKEEQKE